MQALVDQLRNVISTEPTPGNAGERRGSADLDALNGLSRRSKTGYIGVTLHKRTQRFEAHIWSDKKQIYLGAYSNKSQAARAHDVAALKMRAAPTDLNFSDSDYYPIQPHLQALPQADIVAALRSCSRSMPSRPNRQSSTQEGSASRSADETAAGQTEQSPARQSKAKRRKQARPTSALDTHTDIDEDLPYPEVPDSRGLQLQGFPAPPGTTISRQPPPPIKTRRGATNISTTPSTAAAGVSPLLFQNPQKPTQQHNHSPPQLTTPVGSPSTRRGMGRPPVPPLFMGQRGANRELRTVRPSQLAIHPLSNPNATAAAPSLSPGGVQSEHAPQEPPAVSPRAIRAAKRSGVEVDLWGSVFGGISPSESPHSAKEGVPGGVSPIESPVCPKEGAVQETRAAAEAEEKEEKSNKKSPFATPQQHGELGVGDVTMPVE